MDDGAFDQLRDAGPEVLRPFLNSFKPRSEGDSDYSGLVRTFLKSVIARQQEQGERNTARNTPHRYGRDVRDRSRSRDRSFEARPRRGNRRDSSPLEEFRSRYPMEAKAFQILASSSEDVRETVMSDFKPRQEGERDYSGLVIAFVRAVTRRLEDDKDRDRSDNDDRPRPRRRDRSDRRDDDKGSVASAEGGRDSGEAVAEP